MGPKDQQTDLLQMNMESKKMALQKEMPLEMIVAGVHVVCSFYMQGMCCLFAYGAFSGLWEVKRQTSSFSASKSRLLKEKSGPSNGSSYSPDLLRKECIAITNSG